MDGLNRTILAHLMRGVQSDAELASELSMPLHTLRDRIGSMERKGIITGFTEVTTTPTEAWVFMEPRGGATPNEHQMAHKHIQAAYQGPGRFSLVLRLRGDSMVQLGQFLEEHFEPTLYQIHRIRQVGQEVA